MPDVSGQIKPTERPPEYWYDHRAEYLDLIPGDQVSVAREHPDDQILQGLLREARERDGMTQGPPPLPKPTPLKEVEDMETKWLWEPYIQLGNLSTIRGNGGVGKTYLSAAIASAITNPNARRGMPGEIVTSGNVLYFTSEDDPGDFKRRVKQCGGDLEKILIYEHPFSMKANTALLSGFIKEYKVAAVFFDPVQSYLGERVNMDKSNEVRPVLDGLRRVAREEECSITLIEHPNKMTTQDILYRGNGSVDFVNAVRSLFTVGFHPYNEDERVCIQIKTNNRRCSPVSFYISDKGAFEWRGTADDVTADQVVKAKGFFSDRPDNKPHPVYLAAVAIIEAHPEGWSGTASEFIAKASTLTSMPPTTSKSIGKYLNSGECIAALGRKSILMTSSSPRNIKKYTLYRRVETAEEPVSTLQEEMPNVG
jgi:hypothetical protein